MKICNFAGRTAVRKNKAMSTRAISSRAILLTFAMFGFVAAGAQVSVASATIAPGASGIVAVSFAAQGNQVAGIQFDIDYDSTTVSLMALAGPAMRSAEKNSYYSDPSPNLHRVVFAGLNQSQIGDGTVLTLVVNVNANADLGSFTFTINNATAVDPSGNPVVLTGSPGVVTIAGNQVTTGSIQTAGVLSAASLLSGPVAPGELVSLMGSTIGPASPAFWAPTAQNTVSTILGTTQVMFDSHAAPLLYAGASQINAIVPFEIAGQTTTMVTIIQNGQSIGPAAVAVAPAVPGIFTQSSGGTGQGSILNQDFTVNTPTNAAAAGSVIQVYMTGTGQASPTQVTGAISPAVLGSVVLPVTATVGGLAATVVYSGPAPGLVEGATQVNIQLPAGLGPTLAAPVSIQVGTVTTQDDVVVSIGPAAQ